MRATVQTPHYNRIRSLVILLENLPRIQEQGYVPKGTFDLHYFVEETESCGTVACAIGWAGLHPAFRKRGFTTDAKWHVVQYKGARGIEAAMAFFGIGGNAALQWFMPSGYFHRDVSREDVARRIRVWLADRGELGCLA